MGGGEFLVGKKRVLCTRLALKKHSRVSNLYFLCILLPFDFQYKILISKSCTRIEALINAHLFFYTLSAQQPIDSYPHT